VLGESAIVNPETVMDWESEELLKIIDGYKPTDIFNVDETGLFCNPQPSKMLKQKGDSCHNGTKSKRRVTVLVSCNADGTGDWQVQQTPLLQKCNKGLHIKYIVNSSSQITSATFD
jgi:hypothetical protein